MPKCKDCQSEDVALRKSAKGKWYLIDTKRPHFCPKRPKKATAPPPPKPEPLTPEQEEAEGYLEGQGHGKREAQEAVTTAIEALGGAPDVEAIIRELLRRRAEVLAQKN